MEYQIATETPLGKTSKKKKTKRKPAAELEPLGSLPASDLYFHFVFSLGSLYLAVRFIVLSELSFVCWQLSDYELDREQRVKRNHIMMGELVVLLSFFLSSLLVSLIVAVSSGNSDHGSAAASNQAKDSAKQTRQECNSRG